MTAVYRLVMVIGLTALALTSLIPPAPSGRYGFGAERAAEERAAYQDRHAK